MKIIRNSILFFFIILQSLTILAQADRAEIQGEISDQNSAIVVSATIELFQNGQKIQTTTSDERGKFIFRDLTLAGKYVLRVQSKGFAAYEANVSLEKNQKITRFSAVLLPEVKETVVVDESSAQVLDPERAAGAMKLSEREIEALPDDPDQLKDQLQQLAATSGGSPAGAMVTVDGFLANGRLPPKSAIASVSINSNVYSAEYETPPFRAGHIQITTKPGSLKLFGSTFFNFNDDWLNARESFAATRAATQTRQYGFQLGTPIVKKRSGFFLDFEKRDINDAVTVNAVNLNGALVTNVLTPKRLLIGSARADRMIGENRSQVFRIDFNSNKLSNQGTGGFDLPERAFNARQSEQNYRFTDSIAPNAKTANELRIGLTFQKTNQEALSTDKVISVAGAFTAGGANQKLIERNEKRLEIIDNLTLTSKKHSLKAGAQITFRRVSDTREENPNGIFYFGGATIGSESVSPLEQYRRALLGQAAPTRFSVTLGNPSVTVNQWRAAGFIQDEYQFRKNVSLSLGFRYETQTSPADFAGIAPRIGVSYSPDKKQNWVLRARTGIFYERIGEQLTLETLRLNGTNQREILIDAPAFPNPFAGGGTIANSNQTLKIFEDGLRPPASLQTRFDVERQLPGQWKIMATQNWVRSWYNLRSRNINAPLISALNPDPRSAPRPFGTTENILQFESSGKTAGRIFFIGVYQVMNQYFNLFSGYTNSNFKTDADTPFSIPQSSYDASDEWARPASQSKHRGFITGILNLPKNFRTIVILNAVSGRPFNVTTGRDNNGDGNFADRPSITTSADSRAILTAFGWLTPDTVNGNLPRNVGTNPATVTLDLNFTRTFVFGQKDEGGGRRLAFNIRFNNLFNRTNPLDINGVLTSPFFGRANTAAPPRRIELGLRFSF